MKYSLWYIFIENSIHDERTKRLFRRVLKRLPSFERAVLKELILDIHEYADKNLLGSAGAIDPDNMINGNAGDITKDISITVALKVKDIKSDSACMAVIAHELAHVYLGIEFLRGYGQFTEGREAKLEERVTNACAKKWGFDMRSLYKWFRSNECEDICMGVIRQYKLERKPEDFAKDNTDGSKAVDVPAS